MLLSSIGTSENGETESKAITTEHSIVIVTNLAAGRSDLRSKWYKQSGNVHVVTEGAIICVGLSIDGFAFNDGRIHG